MGRPDARYARDFLWIGDAMFDQHRDPIYERYLAPYALFLGMSVSFGACCVAGILGSRCNLFPEFERFHAYINIATLFHPTASQVRNLGRAKLDPDKIIVVVGGNSVLYGSGQRPEHVWTRKLQSLLGDRYQVINFATPGAQLAEFGGTAAEILSRDYARLIFLTNASPASPAADPDGHSLYRFLFWDAYYKNLLTSDDAREKRLAELVGERQDLPQFSELKAQMWLDHYFYFRDLWTTLAYTHVATIWADQVGLSFLKPRKCFRDPGQEVPFEHRYLPSVNETAMSALRIELSFGNKEIFRSTPTDSSRPSNCTSDSGGSNLVRSLNLAIPQLLRRRTLFTLEHRSPFYVQQLTCAEKADYDRLIPETVRILERAGFNAVEIGQLYTDSAFCDYCHFSEDGGQRLAEDLAPKIRDMAQRLGYLGKCEPQ